MNMFKIDIYRQHSIAESGDSRSEHLISSLYRTQLALADVVNNLRRGEGIAIECISPKDDIALIRFEFLMGQSEEGLLNWLDSNCTLLGDDRSGFTNSPNVDIVVSIEGLDFEGYSPAEFEAFINELVRDNQIPITKTVQIFEHGASGHFTDFILNIAAGFSQAAIVKIYDYLSDRSQSGVEIRQLDLSSIKSHIAENYDVNINSIYLTSTRICDGDKRRYSFSSRYKTYNVIADEKGNVIESESRRLSQTEI